MCQSVWHLKMTTKLQKVVLGKNLVNSSTSSSKRNSSDNESFDSIKNDYLYLLKDMTQGIQEWTK